MAGFVDYGHQGVSRLVLAIARRDAHIACSADGEGMQAFIEPTMLELKAELRRYATSQRLLGRDWELTLRFNRRRPGILTLEHALQELRQESRVVGKDRV